jgi:uncharacterized protein
LLAFGDLLIHLPLMKRIGLLSDTHNYLHPELERIFSHCDEIWHAGDMGSIELAERLRSFKPLRGVYGNIDGQDIRQEYPIYLRFRCEDMDVLITHIGGYPGNYQGVAKKLINEKPPALFISGHSHILKVMHDKRLGLLHLNPGAAGRSGFHKVITFMRFVVDGNRVRDLEIVEFER